MGDGMILFRRFIIGEGCFVICGGLFLIGNRGFGCLGFGFMRRVFSYLLLVLHFIILNFRR